jgi:hypothetical protein
MSRRQTSDLLFQVKPRYSVPSLHKPKGWTATVAGYLYESDKLARLILRNMTYMDLPYTWAVTIKIHKVLSSRQIRDMWKRVRRKLLDGGFVGLWVIEPHHDNTVHYHMIASSHRSQQKQLARLIEKAMPPRSELPYHKQVAQIKSVYHWARYMTKAKTRGTYRGRVVPDAYQTKRLLFLSGLNPRLQKSREIGSFWRKPKHVLWKEICDIEKRIATGLKDNRVQDLATYVHELLGRTVNLNRIQRSFGFSSEMPSVQDWIASLAGDPPKLSNQKKETYE